MGHFHAKIGRTDKDEHLRNIIGKNGIGNRTEKGVGLVDFCIQNKQVVMNTWFKHHIGRLYTWKSPEVRYRNQIHFIIIKEMEALYN